MSARASALLAVGDYARAFASADWMIIGANEPSDLMGRLLSAFALQQMGKKDAAEARLAQAIAIDAKTAL